MADNGVIEYKSYKTQKNLYKKIGALLPKMHQSSFKFSDEHFQLRRNFQQIKGTFKRLQLFLLNAFSFPFLKKRQKFNKKIKINKCGKFNYYLNDFNTLFQLSKNNSRERKILILVGNNINNDSFKEKKIREKMK